MKTIKQTFNLILTVALWLVAVQTAFAQKMVVKTADGKVVKYNVAKVTEVTFEEAEPVEWVDLGLPSGTLWASCNIGANNPEDYGDFFAWGETEQKSDYTWSTYFDYDESSHRSTKYCNDGGLTELLPEDDAASTTVRGTPQQQLHHTGVDTAGRCERHEDNEHQERQQHLPPRRGLPQRHESHFPRQR